MEALAALSLAGTVVQFVDFGSRLLSTGKELYNSSTGSLTANEEIHLVTADLVVIVRKLRDAGSTSIVFEKVCNEAIKIAEELIQKLDGLKVGGTNKRWKSFRQAIQTALSEKDIKALQDRLGLLKQALETHILLSLRENVDLVMIRFSQRFDNLDHQTKNIVTALLETRSERVLKDSLEPELQDQTRALTQLLNRIETSNVDEHQKTRALVLERHVNNSVDVTEQLPRVSLKSEILGVSPEEEKQLRLAVRTSILESLVFPTMNNRYKEVQEAYKRTLEWIFYDQQAIEAGNLPWDCFTRWLDDECGVYWLNGKAGSGKSTLMRYLCDDIRTRTRLNRWADGAPLQIVSFFFWNSGTPEQRSQIGLLQALLFEILHEEPELIPIVLPTEWARVYSRHVTGQPVVAKKIWSLSSLTAAFKSLFKQTAVPFKLCLFIDGLDEYEGDHEEMATLFKEVTLSPNVKACISSRPWVVFQDSFKACPSLRLQDLTKGDIVFYTSSKLNNSELFQLLEEKEPERAPELVLEISRRANGVFLWVKIVVASLLNGLRSRDGIEDLQRRLDALPRELEPLYQHMISLIDLMHQAQASEIFQIFRTSREHPRPVVELENAPLTLYSLFLATSKELTWATVGSYDDQMVESVSAEMEARLTARCAGLLEITGALPEKATKTVQYLHRTAKDFVESPKKWEELLGYTNGTNFHSDTALLKSCALQLNTPSTGHIPFLEQKAIAIRAIGHAFAADNDTQVSHAELLDQLDDVMTSRLRDSPGMKHLHWTSSIDESESYLDNVSSFASLAVQFGLLEYVKELAMKSKWNKETLKKPWTGQSKYCTPELPLLGYAVAPGTTTSVCRPELVALLLEHGADPNEMAGRYTPWARALEFVVQDSYVNQTPDQLWKHFQILELLVGAGASPKVTTVQHGLDQTPLKVIASRFDKVYPQEMCILEEKLRKRGGEFAPHYQKGKSSPKRLRKLLGALTGSRR